jgi:quinol monooxygenase YgiN
MSVPVLIGFAGVLVAAVATGLLAGRCFRQPRLDLILWTAATLGLTIALAAQAMGFDRGFSPATFRAVQLSAVLLAPLWLGWGLVERVAAGDGARFTMRLLCSALTVVAGVILATDPLGTRAFGKSWPLASQHYQPISDYLLDVVQAAAVIAAVATAALAAARARNDRRWLAALAGIAPVGLAVLITAALRLSLPSRSLYPLLCLIAAALVWFGATRLAPRGAAGEDRSRRARGSRAARGVQADEYPPADQDGLLDAPYRRADPRERVPRRPDRDRAGAPGAPGVRGAPGVPVGFGDPAATAAFAGAGAEFGAPSRGTTAAGPAAPAAAGPAAASAVAASAVAKPYGRILIFTLLEDRVADFDRLAEQTAEEVMTSEPDTLVYVIHLVPNAPMQRIFYEIYRDRAAFDRHESQPYMQRFVADRRSLVLATNVIELRLKFAKVAPLPAPAPDPALPAIPRAQLPAGQGAQGWGPPLPQSLQPLPPTRTQRRHRDG